MRWLWYQVSNNQILSKIIVFKTLELSGFFLLIVFYCFLSIKEQTCLHKYNFNHYISNCLTINYLFMKKITLFLLALFTSWQINSQVGIVQSFVNTTTPTGWNLGAGSLSTVESCATASWRGNIWEYNSQSILSSNNQISNGADLTIAFDYKIVDYFFSGTPVATNPYAGTISTEVSIDGGATWTITAGIINGASHTASISCATVSYLVPGPSVPAGVNRQQKVD